MHQETESEWSDPITNLDRAGTRLKLRLSYPDLRPHYRVRNTGCINVRVFIEQEGKNYNCALF